MTCWQDRTRVVPRSRIFEFWVNQAFQGNHCYSSLQILATHNSPAGYQWSLERRASPLTRKGPSIKLWVTLWKTCTVPWASGSAVVRAVWVLLEWRQQMTVGFESVCGEGGRKRSCFRSQLVFCLPVLFKFGLSAPSKPNWHICLTFPNAVSVFIGTVSHWNSATRTF